MRSYKKWIMFTNRNTFEDIYVSVGISKIGGYLDLLEIRKDVEITSMFPCTYKGVTLRIYWSEK